MPPGFQNGRRLAEDFILAVTGDTGKSRVAVHDVLLHIGNQHAFLGSIEDRGGLAQAVFVVAALGNVAGGTDQAFGLAMFVEQQASA